jgi:hypothetical protein
MKFIRRNIRKLDFYGTPFYFDIYVGHHNYRTTLGAMYSVILVLTTIAFSISKFAIWQMHKVPVVIEHDQSFTKEFSWPIYDNLFTL